MLVVQLLIDAYLIYVGWNDPTWIGGWQFGLGVACAFWEIKQCLFGGSK